MVQGFFVPILRKVKVIGDICVERFYLYVDIRFINLFFLYIFVLHRVFDLRQIYPIDRLCVVKIHLFILDIHLFSFGDMFIK